MKSRWEAKSCDIVKIPFQESIVPIFEAETGINLQAWASGSWCAYWDKAHEAKVRSFEEKYLKRVFLRTLFDCAVALDLLTPAPNEDRTKLGQHFHNAKYGRNDSSIDVLAGKMSEFILSTPGYKSADTIIPVPPSPEKEFDLPTELAVRISRITGKNLITDSIQPAQKKERPLKEVAQAEKWKVLSSAGFVLNKRELGSCILIDDLYQSGSTAHFWASVLERAGAKSIRLLCCVKSNRDTDNM